MKHNGYVVVGPRRSIDGTVMKPGVDLCLVSATTGRLFKHMELLQHALRRGSEQYSTKTMLSRLAELRNLARTLWLARLRSSAPALAWLRTMHERNKASRSALDV